MMGTKTFSSEDEQLRSLLDDFKGPYPLLSREDPVIFHNAEYERELFMEYNLDFGGESSCSSQQQLNDEEPLFMRRETKLEPTWHISPSEAEEPVSSSYSSPSFKTTAPAKASKVQTRQKHVFNPYSSGPLIKEQCSSRGTSSPREYREESPSSKRGRPSKATSNSKMANYARNYREMKKNELSTMTMRNNELEAEMRLLREENAKMKKALSKASEEISQLKKVIDQDSQIARVVANMGQTSSMSSDFARPGVCVHVGSLGTTVEVCKQCADNNLQRLETKFDPLANTELFDGDFTAFDNYLNGTC